IEHRVLRRADVDERGLHAGQHVLHAAEVDVPVDLADVVRRMRHVVLEECSTFEDRDLRDAVVAIVRIGMLHVHAHEVPAEGATLAFATASLLEDVVIELERIVVDESGPPRRVRGTTATAATGTTAVPPATAALTAAALAAAASLSPAASAAASAAAPAPLL